MKEIDFLPDWYKNGRRREFGYRAQYIALVGVFVVMAVWNFTTAHSVSKARAELARRESRQVGAESISAKLTDIKSELADLREKLKSIEEVDSKIDVASVLAEMSFLINDERVVVGKVQLIAEKFAGRQEAKPDIVSVVRVAGVDMGNEGPMPVGDVRFKVVISGIATGAGDVAALVRRFEESPYFCSVIPLFSRDKHLQRGTNSDARRRGSEKRFSGFGESFRVTEFEISCYLANYHERWK